ncbi:MAG: glycyl-radical enzyme activating protein [Clostridiales Family XIII bacterium]|jgi:pyruvate formate lyase activating enzyme|nr:glycyl-radical enzyme activating protein [Clostridiales Family XIII bacterium]
MDGNEKTKIGRLYDIQGFSVHDGPGIRLTLFLKGCPLKCLWCHSPESQAFKKELNRMELKCIGMEVCGKCIPVCPQGAISAGATKTSVDGSGEITVPDVDRSKCNDCGICTESCPAKALYICGTDYGVDEIMEMIRRDIPFYETSGGGVTVSGGECLCQPDFLLEVLRRCHAEGIHTAVDTTGFADWATIEPILPYTDIFLYDLKHMDSEMHQKATGAPNERILENAKKAAAGGAKFQIRIPIIPLYNDTEDDFEKFGAFISELGDAVELVQLLPYHKLGIAKWGRLSAKAPVIEVQPPTDEFVQARKKQLESKGLRVQVH